MLRIACLLLFLSIASPIVFAQPIEGRLTAGVTTFADDGAVNHATVGGGVRFYFSRRWNVEPEFLFMRNSDFTRDRDYVLWGNFSFDILRRERRVVPYLFAGPGLIYHRISFGPTTFATTEAAFGMGGGARFFLTEKIFVAPQVRTGIADGIFGEITGSIGFVLRK